MFMFLQISKSKNFFFVWRAGGGGGGVGGVAEKGVG